MLFNSSVFAVFLVVIFILYWFVLKTIKQQNICILLASLFFYAWWDWRFVSLIIFSSLLDYFIGLRLQSVTENIKRKTLLIISLAANLGLLFTCKYFIFFVESFVALFQSIGIELQATTLSIILPLGISFYTFQTLSYTIDVYRRKFEPTSDVISFMAYITFFPQLVAGPIERAIHLLPQFYKPRYFDKTYALEGLKIMLWGFFKKIVIADGISVLIDPIFNAPENYHGGTLAIAGVLFAVQIYADFSGYSEIAIGTARLFGFSLMKNFNYPYFSTSIIEFWKRWHISLTSWFKDYIYIPLGGNRNGIYKQITYTFIVFIISGIWHGANVTFLLWGIAHALIFIPYLFIKRPLIFQSNTSIRIAINTVAILFTNCIVVLLWFLFRAQNMQDVIEIYSKIFTSDVFIQTIQIPQYIYVVICILFIVEWLGRTQNFAILTLGIHMPRAIRWTYYYILIFSILYYFKTPISYIYFQF